jgi:hypothetical protein
MPYIYRVLPYRCDIWLWTVAMSWDYWHTASKWGLCHNQSMCERFPATKIQLAVSKDNVKTMQSWYCMSTTMNVTIFLSILPGYSLIISFIYINNTHTHSPSHQSYHTFSHHSLHHHDIIHNSHFSLWYHPRSRPDPHQTLLSYWDLISNHPLSLIRILIRSNPYQSQWLTFNMEAHQYPISPFLISGLPLSFYLVLLIFSHNGLFLDAPCFTSIQFLHTLSLLYLHLSLYSFIAYILPLALIHSSYSSVLLFSHLGPHFIPGVL